MWINESFVGAMMGYEAANARIIVVKIKAVRKDLAMVQIYAPDEDEEIR